MVGIVIVSHSAQLAAGVYELVAQMVQDRVPVAVAGGMEDPEQPIGTDPMRVLAAIEEVYSEAGVVVLMDLGSALLSAEMAVEFLSPEQQAHVYLCPAPLVEGAMAAAVQASLGSPIEQVLREARGAISVKEAQLGIDNGPIATVADTGVPAGETLTATFVIENRQGLHARPAARFVRTAGAYEADVIVQKGDRQANARSINQVATLGVRQHDTILVSASGPDAAAVLAALAEQIADRFGETDTAELPTEVEATTPIEKSTGPDQWQGIPASPGFAVGPVAHYRPQLPAIDFAKVANIAAECQRLHGAIEAARSEIEQLLSAASARLGADQAGILEAHLLILQDPILLEAVTARISQEQLNAAAAWQLEAEALAATYQALDDPYMQARVADIQDVSRRVLGGLLAKQAPALQFAEPVILVAAELLPSDTASLDVNQVLGICTAAGGATSHSAILARALGIPAVAGLGAVLEELPEGRLIGLDGNTGIVWSQPATEEVESLQQRRREWLEAQALAQTTSQRPARTRDGCRVEVLANIGRPTDAAAALEYGAEGVGLFRTEFLFLDRTAAPNEEEQLAAYQQAATSLEGRPLIIRTLDIGGDKPIAYLEQAQEDNPFLGLRGIRYCLRYPALFKTQLRAILRAGVGHDLKLMFPMVGTLAELRAARTLLQETEAELLDAGIACNPALPVGIMIEVPSAVAIADRLAREVAFFSIGTNDLTQYVMAADRGNTQVAELVNALQPAVLRMIAQTASAAKQAGIPVGMCGELAGNPLVTPLLIGLGLTELSMSAPAIPAVKTAMSKLTLAEMQQIAEQALQYESAAAVMQYLDELSN